MLRWEQIILSNNNLGRVVLSEVNKDRKAHCRDADDEQEVVIQMSIVHVLREPPRRPAGRGHRRHQLHELRAEQVAERDGQEVERRGRAPSSSTAPGRRKTRSARRRTTRPRPPSRRTAAAATRCSSARARPWPPSACVPPSTRPRPLRLSRRRGPAL
jgi:hypothetical protein